MKKIKLILLVLLLIGVFIYPVLDNLPRAKDLNNPEIYFGPNKFLKKDSDPNWEYLKDRLTTAKGDIFINKYKTPILFELHEASAQDSLAVENTIKELKTLLPHKTIDYFNAYTGKTIKEVWMMGVNLKNKIGEYNYGDLATAAIKIHFDAGELKTIPKELERYPSLNTILEGGNYIARTTKPGSYGRYFAFTNIYFGLDKTLPFNKREQYIKYEMLRSLCDIKPNDSATFSSVLGAVFNVPEYNPDKDVFTSEDKFLLQKLYAPDFENQFEDYLYDHYTWRYATNYISSEGLQYIVMLGIVFLIVVLFMLSKDWFFDNHFKYSYFNYLIPAIILLASITGLHNLYKHLTSFGTIILNGIEDMGILIIIMIFLPAIIISFFAWVFEKYLIKDSLSFYNKLFLKTILLFFAIVIPFYMYYTIMAFFVPEGTIVNLRVNPIYVMAFIIAVLRSLMIYLKSFSDNIIKQKNLELSELKALHTQAELKSLQSQINPHFLYNALNSIAELAHTDSKKTENMALSLSDLFRHSINRQGKKISTIKDEVEMVQNYLEIEQIRFGERLDFSVHVENDLENEEIPMSLLQPLVENAVKHGISKIEDKGIVSLVIKKTEKGLVISVFDNGPDFPQGLVSGHGLQTVSDLLRLNYNDHATLYWQNEPEKKIEININHYL